MITAFKRYILAGLIAGTAMVCAISAQAQNTAPSEKARPFYSADQAELYAAYLLCVEEQGAQACAARKPDLSILIIAGVSFPKDADVLQIELQRTLMRGGLYMKTNGEIAALSTGETVEAVRIDRGEIVIIEGIEIPKTVNPEVIILDPTKQNLGINR